jgi:hypothetical protein
MHQAGHHVAKLALSLVNGELSIESGANIIIVTEALKHDALPI